MHGYGSLRMLVTQMTNKGTVLRIHKEHLKISRTGTPGEKLGSDLKRRVTKKRS